MKKVLKDIVYCTIEEAQEGSCNIAMIVDGHDLICADPVDAIEILQHHNLIKR
jgi:hypothetical protein